MINNSILSALPFELLRVASHLYPTILLSAGITAPIPIIPRRAFGALERIGWRVHPFPICGAIIAIFRGVRGNFINRLHFYTPPFLLLIFPDIELFPSHKHPPAINFAYCVFTALVLICFVSAFIKYHFYILHFLFHGMGILFSILFFCFCFFPVLFCFVPCVGRILKLAVSVDLIMSTLINNFCHALLFTSFTL